jgi:HK97 gp10 family phage protein
MQRNLKRATDKMINRAKSAVHESTDEIRQEAQAIVPVATGTLQRSIEIIDESKDSKTQLVVGSKLEYAPHVEYGTSKMSPQPYLTPAYQRVAHKLRSKVADNIRSR